MIFTKSFKPKLLYLLEFYGKIIMLGTFANIKIPMKCHRLGIILGDMVREMKTKTRNEDQDVPVLP